MIEAAAPTIALRAFGYGARATTVANLAVSAASALAASPGVSESSVSALLTREADAAVAKALAQVAPWAVPDVEKYLAANIPAIVQEAVSAATAKVASLAGKV
nr:hypothetical protein [uncultured Rhodopila sp.]